MQNSSAVQNDEGAMQVEKKVLHNVIVRNLMGQLSRSEKGEERKHPCATHYGYRLG